MFHDFMVVLFCIAVGLTASGIVANFYRLLGCKPETLSARVGYLAVMSVAGPSVLFDNAARAWRRSRVPALAFWLAAAIAGYWSLALGLLVLSIVIADLTAQRTVSMLATRGWRTMSRSPSRTTEISSTRSSRSAMSPRPDSRAAGRSGRGRRSAPWSSASPGASAAS